ncbi:MAG TPA: hypothetical protein VJS47_10740 [Rhizomicrobium sp.]|nr:hypothetical protein [Rhizomicrobium sp.]
MGIGIVLIFWLIVGSFAALVGSVILRAIATFLVQKSHPARKRVMRVATILPFAGLGWLFAVFVFQATINVYLGRDPGIGDSWNTPLPNGYRLIMIDVTDHGTVYNPKTLPPDTIAGQDDNVFDVSQLQLSGRYMLGALTPDNSYGGSYFLLDTQSGKRLIFPDFDRLGAALGPLGIKPDLRPIETVYSQYGGRLFGYVVLALMLIPPMFVFVLFCRWVLRIRKSEVLQAT